MKCEHGGHTCPTCGRVIQCTGPVYAVPFTTHPTGHYVYLPPHKVPRDSVPDGFGRRLCPGSAMNTDAHGLDQPGMFA